MLRPAQRAQQAPYGRSRRARTHTHHGACCACWAGCGPGYGGEGVGPNRQGTWCYAPNSWFTPPCRPVLLAKKIRLTFNWTEAV